MTLAYQLDASSIATLFSDTGKTTQVSDGGTVAVWTAPNGSITTDALQSTSGNRPTYRSNYGSSGYAAVEFDGSNDHLSVAHSSAWNVSIIDLFLVLTSTSLASGTYRGIVGKWSNGSWNDGWGVAYALGVLSLGAPHYTNVACKATINNRLLLHCHFENGCNGCIEGGIYGGSTAGAGPANNSTSVFVGRADPSGAYYFAGAMNELRVYAGGETDATILNVKNDLRRKWGLAAISGGGSLINSQQLVRQGWIG